MWLLVARPPLPDARCLPGRRCLAAIDALLWPLLWVIVVSHAPPAVGIVGPIVTAMAIVYGVVRLHRALWFTHRYWFTTWRWGRVVVLLLLIGAVLKMAVSV